LAEEIAVENGRIADFQGLMTLNLDWVILQTAMHHSSTSTYIPISLKSKKLFVDGRTFETHIIRSTRSRPNYSWRHHIKFVDATERWRPRCCSWSLKTMIIMLICMAFSLRPWPLQQFTQFNWWMYTHYSAPSGP